MNRKLKYTLMGTALLATVGTALAFGGPDGGCERGGARMGAGHGAHGYMRALQQLDNLSDEQRSQLNALRQSQQAQRQAQRQSREESRQALRDAMQNNADAETIKKLAEAEGQAVTAMIMQQAEMKRQIDAILTEEQRKALADMPSRYKDKPMREEKQRW